MTHLARRAPLAAALLLLALVAPAVASTPAGINEFVANHTGSDTYSFVELHGAPNQLLSGYRVLEIEGDADSTSGTPGTVDHVFTPGTASASGHWASSFPPARDIENGTITLLVVTGWSGAQGDDLDTDDDGTLDVTPWTGISDSVAVSDGGAGDRTYSTVVLTASFDGGAFTVGGASRIPDAADTDAVADWKRNDFDGAGLPGFTGNWTAGEAVNTPGAANADVVYGEGARLNEIVRAHDGADAFEHVEVYGEPTSSYANTRVLAVAGDAETNPGLITAALVPGTTNGAGLWDSGFLTQDTLGDGSATYLLVEGFSGAVGNDLDVDDDGTLDLTPWTALLDALALPDGGASDRVYSAVALAPGFDGVADTVGGASRYPNGVDTDSAADWVRDDAARAAFGGALARNEAFDTPGAPNLRRREDLWAGVSTVDAASLRSTLHAAVDDHVFVPYTSSETDTWDVLNEADQDPVNSGAILDVYKNATYTKIPGGTGPYNREHTWPNSWGFNDATSSYPYTDCHHLFASDVTYNSNRGNLPYGTCSPGCTENPTDNNHGAGGGIGLYPGNSNWLTGSGNTGTYETWGKRRGDVARALLYLDVRYEGGTHGATAATEPDLRLTDNTALITNGVLATAYMGRLATLLQWHQQDPPDARERRRNDVVYRSQANRNPFIDHPEWVGCLHGVGPCPLFVDGFAFGDEQAWSATVPAIP